MRYTFDVTCPTCGSDPEHQTNSAPDPRRQAAVIRCGNCRRRLLLRLDLLEPDTCAQEGA